MKITSTPAMPAISEEGEAGGSVALDGAGAIVRIIPNPCQWIWMSRGSFQDPPPYSCVPTMMFHSLVAAPTVGWGTSTWAPGTMPQAWALY